MVSSSPISFLGGVDPAEGVIVDAECDSRGLSISGKVFCFPFGKGSTVGSYAMYQLKLNGRAPAAIINNSAEPVIATGAIIADIPMVDGVDVALLRSGDEVAVDADEGNVELPEVVEKHVVNSIVRSKGRVLLLQRSDKVGSYRGQWAGVSGFIEPHEADKEAARRELLEEVSIESPRFVRKIDPIRFRDKGTVWCVHPFLVQVTNPKIRIDWEHQAYEWVAPEEVARYQTVPGLQQVICRLLDM